MNSANSTFWFTLSKHTYVSFNSQSPILLYNTHNGKTLVVHNSKCLEIVQNVYEPSNLGVIEINPEKLGEQVYDFIEKSVALGIGIKMEKTISSNKPINLLPILNLQNDVEKLASNGENHLIGEFISNYLTTLTLYIVNQCAQNCVHCNKYFKQTHFCTTKLNGNFLPLETFKTLLSQTESTQLKKVNFLGGDLVLYPHWKDLLCVLKQYSYDYHFWFHLQNLSGVNLDDVPGKKEILVTYPCDEERLGKYAKEFFGRNDVTFRFLIDNDKASNYFNKLLEHLEHLNFEFIPFYNGENIDFITQNVFLDENDILSETLEMREIFCNQKLNSNFFGSLSVFPDGSVKASPNTPDLGKLPENTLLELIYKELTSNTAWRKVRAEGKCNSCMYRFLCPPPGNLESVLGKEDLCHVDMKVVNEFQEI